MAAAKDMIEMALQPWPIVREGDKAHPVPSLQYHLRARGHTVVVDGDFGPRTEAAVREWQQFLHDHDEPAMLVDGIVGPMTWQSLISGMYAVPADRPDRQPQVPSSRTRCVRLPSTRVSSASTYESATNHSPA